MFALISCEKPGRIPARLQGARLAGRIGRLAVVELQRAQLSALREYLQTQGGEIFSAWERSQAFVRETPRERRARREDRRQARRERRRRLADEAGQSLAIVALMMMLLLLILLVLCVLGAGSGPEVGSVSNSWGVIPRLFEFVRHFPLQ